MDTDQSSNDDRDLDEVILEDTRKSVPEQEKSYLTYQQVVEEQSERATEYHKVTVRLQLIVTLLSIVLLGLLVYLRIPNAIRDISPNGNGYSFLSVAFVAIIILIINFIIDLPISYYQETIEREYEFATRSNGDWIKDKLKEFVLSLIIFTVVIEAIFLALHFQPDLWWFYAFLGYFVFAGVLSSLAPFLISIFTKIEPLEEGEVRSTVENLANQMGLDYDDIYNWSMSEQTTKANAAVVGFGNTIRIMLGDTLTSNFRTDEIEVVMAHEIAHQQNKDVYRGILFNGVISLIAFYLIDLSFPAALDLFDLNAKSDPATVGYLIFSLTIILEILGKLSLWYSRRREKAADLVAIDQLGNLEVFESAFARLSEQNLSFPNPSKLEILWRYSHPPIRDRIEYAKSYQKSR